MTCVLHEKELCILVSKLVADFMNNEGKDLNRPIKVIFNLKPIKTDDVAPVLAMLSSTSSAI